MTNLKKLPSAIQFALFVGTAAMVSGNAFAQEAQDPQQQEQADEEDEVAQLETVTVTGSRIQRVDAHLKLTRAAR